MCNGNKIQDTDITFTSTRGISGLLIEEQSLKEYTIGIINHYLEKYNNNVLLVAQKLDIGKSTIYRMLKEE
jgi:transcriptional regulator with PAS, ATPase and Fis domain